MATGLVSILLVIVALAMLPMGLRWLQARLWPRGLRGDVHDRIVSVLAVGPQQHVVTVEVGPPEARVWLTVGVSPQQVCTLHTAPAPVASASQALSPSQAA